MRKLRLGAAALAVSALALVMSLGSTAYALTGVGAPSAHRAAQATLPSWHALTFIGGWVYGG